VKSVALRACRVCRFSFESASDEEARCPACGGETVAFEYSPSQAWISETTVTNVRVPVRIVPKPPKDDPEK
jgi:hypothetical protein